MALVSGDGSRRFRELADPIQRAFVVIKKRWARSGSRVGVPLSRIRDVGSYVFMDLKP